MDLKTENVASMDTTPRSDLMQLAAIAKNNTVAGRISARSMKRRREEKKAPRKITRPSAPTEAIPRPQPPRDSARGRTYSQESKTDMEAMKEFDDDNFAVYKKYKYGKREDYTGDPTWVFTLTGMRPQLLPVAQVPEVFELRETVTTLEKQLQAESQKRVEELQTKEKEWQELFDHHVRTAKNWATSK